MTRLEKLILVVIGFALLALLGSGVASDPAQVSSEARFPATGVQERWELKHRDSLAALVPSANLAEHASYVGLSNQSIGRSLRGSPIHLTQVGNPTLSGRVLVVGCIHGDECAGRLLQPVRNGCPAPGGNIYLLRNLNPDGYRLATRLNGRGVDLNRNFPSGWKPIGSRGSPQYSGPQPFSEPETRLAAHMIQWLQPEVTIWFHQHAGPAYVRAWGPSIPLARRYARLAGLPFHPLPWLAGTAPHWQNHRFPGTTSFVVELPDGDMPIAMRNAQSSALVDLARAIARQG